MKQLIIAEKPSVAQDIAKALVATYEQPVSLNDKDAITKNMLVMGKVSNGVVTFARSEDAQQNAVVKRKK